MLNLLLASAAFLPQSPGTSTAPVCINEFCYDDGGTDNYEFVELYNRSAGPVDISGWKVVVNDSASPGYGGSGTGTVPTHVIPAGTVLAPGAFFLLGNAALVPASVPGVSLQLPVNSIENGGSYTAFDFESIELQDPNGTIIDSLVYEMGYAPGPFGPHPLEGNGFFGDFACGDGAVLPSCSTGRWIDGWDDNVNQTDFLTGMYPTPGASNNRPSALPYVDTFDNGIAGSTVPGWVGGFVTPKYVDPTIIDSQNPIQRPASPIGGLAMSMWDSSGGGNTVYFDTAPVADVVVETFAYFEPPMTPVNPNPGPPYSSAGVPVVLDTYNVADGEWWGIGVRGSAAPNGNPANVPGTYFNDIALGVGLREHYFTGICWACYRTPTYSRLYLVDMHDGPTNANPANFTILGGPIDIVSGVNDGWQRLRLHVQGPKVIGNFGGTFGNDDGTRISATTTTNTVGQVYVSYREALLYNLNGLAGCHPPMFDFFDIHAPTTSQSFVGTASPTSTGLPDISSDGLAILGSTGFAELGAGMIPLGAPNYAFCGLAIGFSPFAPGYPLGGAPATAHAYILPIETASIGFADATGHVRFPFGVPANGAFLGVQLVTQLVDFDPFLPYGLPIGLSRAMVNVIGN